MESLKPREKARMHGIGTLSDAELLALLLKVGTKDMDVFSLSQNILSKFGSLKMIYGSSYEELIKIKGLGPVKALNVLAISELMKRIEIQKITKITETSEAVSLAHNKIGSEINEKFLVVLLNRRKEVIAQSVMYSGIEDEVMVEPKEVVGYALKNRCNYFYCFHNHPSGDVKPSRADELLTLRIKNMLQMFNIKFVAHIIINNKGDYCVI